MAHDSDPADKSSHFVRQMIQADVDAGTFGRPVQTRFPPEPNGYLHIGHAKAICLDFGMAAEFGGRCFLRFDDTNPETEDPEFVASILADIRWLGFEPDEVRYASDYFEQMYALAEKLVTDGKAYVCELDDAQIREWRGTVTEPGRASPQRDRSVEENLTHLRAMRAGEFPDGHCTLRARIDMGAANMKMRDPLIYRIRHAHHFRQGDAWKIYPLYDFAHCLGDAIEGVTHSLCTLEFENNRELYDWFLEHTGFERPPRQTEFARLALTGVVMSKRKLKALVEDGHVDGWDDPRMPTLAGLRRRGIRPQAIRDFCERVGVAKANSTVDHAAFDATVRDDLNHEAPRIMAVLDPLEVVIDNMDADAVEWLDASYWPHDVPREGTRKVPFTRTLFIERDDFAEVPPKKFRRLAPGREVRLRYGYYVTCTGVEKAADGTITRLRCTYDPDTRGGTSADGRRVAGTIHWVSATQGLPARVRLYGKLFATDTPGADGDWLTELDPASLRQVDAVVEPSVAADPPNTRYQFERQGYFWRDPELGRGDDLVFNRIVALKDSFKKKKQAPPPLEDAPTVLIRRDAPVERVLDAATAAAAQARVDAHGIGTDDAVVLVENPDLGAFFDAAVSGPGSASGVANWVVNNLAAAAKADGLDALRITPAGLSALVALAEADTISGRTAKDLFARLCADGGDPDAIVAAEGLGKVSDAAALQALVDEVLAAHPDEVAKYRGGRNNLRGFFVGQVMRRTGGKADAKLVNQLLSAALDG